MRANLITSKLEAHSKNLWNSGWMNNETFNLEEWKKKGE